MLIQVGFAVISLLPGHLSARPTSPVSPVVDQSGSLVTDEQDFAPITADVRTSLCRYLEYAYFWAQESETLPGTSINSGITFCKDLKSFSTQDTKPKQ